MAGFKEVKRRKVSVAHTEWDALCAELQSEKHAEFKVQNVNDTDRTETSLMIHDSRTHPMLNDTKYQIR